MLADLDLLLTTVFCPADDLLPERAKNARRRFDLRYSAWTIVDASRSFTARGSRSSDTAKTLWWRLPLLASLASRIQERRQRMTFVYSRLPSASPLP